MKVRGMGGSGTESRMLRGLVVVRDASGLWFHTFGLGRAGGFKGRWLIGRASGHARWMLHGKVLADWLYSTPKQTVLLLLLLLLLLW